MRPKLQAVLVGLTSLLLGLGAATVSYLAARELRPVTVSFTGWSVLTPTVRPGGNVNIAAVYTKLYDCAGRMIVDFDESGPRAGRIIFEQTLGNREPGVWELLREYRIPEDAVPGPARLREVMIYDCHGRTDLIRSPWAEFTIVKE